MSIYFSLPTTLPASALKVNTSVMDIKKTWEKLPCLSHYLAFALPFFRDKQLSQPTPIAYYINRYAAKVSTHTMGYTFGIRV